MSAPGSAGVDYVRLARAPLLKRMARRLLLVPPLNRAVVRTLAALPATRWTSRIPVVGSARMRIDDAHQVLLRRADRCQVAKELYWNRGELRSPADRLAVDLAVRLSANAQLFLDIGAYTGLFALCVARRNPDVAVHAYEIVAENFLLMWENVIENDLVARVEPRLVALGSEAGEIRVPAALGAGALASSVALDSASVDGVRIPVATLDAMYPSFTGHAVLKIDVEGFEWDVLRGGRELLARSRPDIVCEVLRRAPHIPQIEEMLRALEFHAYHITDRGLRRAERIVPAKYERDWLFSSRSASELASLGFPFVAA